MYKVSKRTYTNYYRRGVEQLALLPRIRRELYRSSRTLYMLPEIETAFAHLEHKQINIIYYRRGVEQPGSSSGS